MATFVLFARALAVLLYLSPIGKPHEQLPGWAETPEARLRRYYSIALDTVVVADEVCRGNRACAVNVIHMALGVAWHESGFAPDVDLGPCYRGADGKGPRCDGGDAHSMWQLHPMSCVTGPNAPPGPCAESVLYDTDRRAAMREALRRMWRSIRECQHALVPKEDWYAVYAGGGCKLSAAVLRSHELMGSIARAVRAPDLPAAPVAPVTVAAPVVEVAGLP
jgi:hypothetical protein